MTGVPDILEALGQIGPAAEPGPATARSDRLDEESALILQMVRATGVATPAILTSRSGLPLHTVLRQVALLKQAGLIHHRDGGIVPSPPVTAAP